MDTRCWRIAPERCVSITSAFFPKTGSLWSCLPTISRADESYTATSKDLRSFGSCPTPGMDRKKAKECELGPGSRRCSGGVRSAAVTAGSSSSAPTRATSSARVEQLFEQIGAPPRSFSSTTPAQTSPSASARLRSESFRDTDAGRYLRSGAGDLGRPGTGLHQHLRDNNRRQYPWHDLPESTFHVKSAWKS